MKHIFFFLVLALCSVTGPVMAADSAQYGSGYAGGTLCESNCVEMRRSGNKLLFFARNRDGEVFTTTHLSLPRGARAVADYSDWNGQGGTDYISRMSGLPVGTTCGGVSGVCTEHSSVTYETSTHYVVVSITYFFFDGELQDIDVDETRITKSKIK